MSVDTLGFLRSFSPWLALLLSVILGGFALRDGVTAWTAWRAADAIESVAAAPSAGLVLVEGIAAAAAGIPGRAPLTGTAAAWHAWQVERRAGGSRPHWVLEGSGASQLPFLVRRPDGDVLVLPGSARSVGLPERVWTGEEEQPRPGAPPQGPIASFFASYRYSETVLQPGRPVFVVGRPVPAEPGDPPGVTGRIVAGEREMIIGGEPPREGARRERREAAWIGIRSAGFLALIGLLWLVRL